MKKFSLFLVLVSFFLLAVIPASAADKTKADYYVEISGILSKIENALNKGNIDAAKTAVQELRASVYSCAKFLVVNNEYNDRIMKVITVAEDALSHKNPRAYIGEAREIAASVLLDKDADDKGSGGSDDGGSNDDGWFYQRYNHS